MTFINPTIYAHAMEALQGAEKLSINPNFVFADTAFPRMVTQNHNNPDGQVELFKAVSDFTASNPASVVTKELKAMYPDKF